MLITVDIHKTAKERTYTWETMSNINAHYVRMWRVVKLFGFIPIFAWVVREDLQ